jgi:hypothetical protein|tara:strand:+ start:90 stop:281 length:192 start_codon:yes stop_codon:yes gene_type:complete
MIKWIKSLLKKIFGKKEPIILKDEVKIVIKIPVIETPVIEKIVCNTHKTRFKKSCPTCIEAAK